MAEETISSVEAAVREICRKTRTPIEHSAGEILCRRESTITELCRREGIHQNMHYKWSKEFLESGKQRLVGDTKREADSHEVEDAH